VSGLAFAQVEAILLFGNHTISEYLRTALVAKTTTGTIQGLPITKLSPYTNQDHYSIWLSKSRIVSRRRGW